MLLLPQQPGTKNPLARNHRASDDGDVERRENSKPEPAEAERAPAGAAPPSGQSGFRDVAADRESGDRRREAEGLVLLPRGGGGGAGQADVTQAGVTRQARGVGLTPRDSKQIFF